MQTFWNSFWLLNLLNLKIRLKMLYFAYWRPSKRATTVNAIWSIWKCIIKSTWVINYAKIVKHGQNLRFHFLVKKWQSLGELLRKKNRKSWKHVFYTNWTILSKKQKFLQKKFLDHSKSLKNRGGLISWSSEALGLTFSG